MSMLFMAILAAGLIGSFDDTVVSTAWLEQNLDNPGIVLVEIGSSPVADHPHIPGAHFVPIEAIVARQGWPPDELPPVDQLRQAFENAGVGDDGRIILYSSNPLWATRAWFTLDYLGQGDRVAILDGGFSRWLAEKRMVTNARIPHLAKTFTPRPDPTRIVDLATMRTAAAGDTTMIDARSPYEFYGLRRGKQVTRRGHVPGAHCEPWQANLMKNGEFKPRAELQSSYARMIPRKDAQVIVYCRTGMEATMPYFILRSLGYDVALFDGSFTEWSRDNTTPVAKLARRR